MDRSLAVEQIVFKGSRIRVPTGSGDEGAVGSGLGAEGEWTGVMVSGQGDERRRGTVRKGVRLWGREVRTGKVVAGVMRSAVGRVLES